jgi:hypothetical protein
MEMAKPTHSKSGGYAPQILRSKKPITFGGKNFFPTSAPMPLCAVHKCIGGRLPRRIAKRIAGEVRLLLAKGRKDIKAPNFFKIKQVLAKVWVKDGDVRKKVDVPVSLHRGTHVNTRHQPDYIAPKKRRAV